MSQSYIKNLSRARFIRRPYHYPIIRTLNSQPVTIVPNTRPDILLLPANFFVEFKAGVPYPNLFTLNLAYSDGTVIIQSFSTIGDVDNISYRAAINPPTPLVYLDLIGKGLVVTASADNTSGTGKLAISFDYQVITHTGEID